MKLHNSCLQSPGSVIRAAVFFAATTWAGICAAQPYGATGPGGGPMGGPAMGGPMGLGNMMHSGAVATLGPTQGNAVTGLVRFDQRGDTIWVHAHVVGLEPNSVHGFHIHDKGSCASADGTSAGGHFNPEGHPHGPQDAAHHAGDMPNLQADGQGVADVSFELHGVTIGSGPDNIVGRSVVIHGSPDDYKSQPAGNSGPRVACGVIASW